MSSMQTQAHTSSYPKQTNPKVSLLLTTRDKLLVKQNFLRKMSNHYIVGLLYTIHLYNNVYCRPQRQSEDPIDLIRIIVDKVKSESIMNNFHSLY